LKKKNRSPLEESHARVFVTVMLTVAHFERVTNEEAKPAPLGSGSTGGSCACGGYRPIKVGILHSLSEPWLSGDVPQRRGLDALEEINAAAVCLAKDRAVVVDPRQTAALCREGTRPNPEPESRRGFRLLDIGITQIRAAVFEELMAFVLPGSV